MEKVSNYEQLEEERMNVGEQMFYVQRQGGILQSDPFLLLKGKFAMVVGLHLVWSCWGVGFLS